MFRCALLYSVDIADNCNSNVSTSSLEAKFSCSNSCVKVNFSSSTRLNSVLASTSYFFASTIVRLSCAGAASISSVFSLNSTSALSAFPFHVLATLRASLILTSKSLFNNFNSNNRSLTEYKSSDSSKSSVETRMDDDVCPSKPLIACNAMSDCISSTIC